MIHARMTVCGQDKVYENVLSVEVRSDGQYIFLNLDAHPTRVAYWLGHTKILLAATGEDFTAMLREERALREE